jgi:hypothetical protein
LRTESGVTGPTRRAVLAASAAALPLLLASCKGVQALGMPPPPPRDIAALRQAISAEHQLVRLYGAAIRHLTGQAPASPAAAGHGLAGRLHEVLAEHQQHLTRLTARLIQPAADNTSASPPAAAALVRGSSAAVLGQLEQAEQAQSSRLTGDITLLPPALAQLFASIAAAEATHLPLLRGQASPAAASPPPAPASPAPGRSAPASPAPAQASPAAGAVSPAAGALKPGGGKAAELAALQAALAAEQAASYGYGVLGAHLSGKRWIAATDDWVAHQRGRDQLTSMIIAIGGQPVPSAVGYQLPSPVRSAAGAQALAVTLEDGVAQSYLGLVALPEPALRELGAAAVRAAALRATTWRGSTVAFPGLPAASPSG